MTYEDYDNHYDVMDPYDDNPIGCYPYDDEDDELDPDIDPPDEFDDDEEDVMNDWTWYTRDGGLSADAQEWLYERELEGCMI